MRCLSLKFIPAACVVLLSAVYPCLGAAQDAVAPTRMKLQQGAEAVKVQVKNTDLSARSFSKSPAGSAAPISTISPTGTDEPAGQTHGPWIAALVLMAAIAIRRQLSERH